MNFREKKYSIKINEKYTIKFYYLNPYFLKNQYKINTI